MRSSKGIRSWQRTQGQWCETVSISFDFKFSHFKRTGSVYKWDGVRWVKVATKVVQPTGDDQITWATASGFGNGTYVLIIFNYGVPTVVAAIG